MSIPKQYNNMNQVHKWSYRNANEEIIGYNVRYENDEGKKSVIPFFIRDGDDFSPGINLNPRPLYGLDLLANLSEEEPVFVVEGEKCARALHQLGFCATTSIGGANAAAKTDWKPLNGVKKVYLILDNDAPGTQYGKDVNNILTTLPSPPEVNIVPLSLENEGDDIVDWIKIRLNDPNDWNGYSKLDQDDEKFVRSSFLKALKNAEPVPDEWKTPVSTFDWTEPNKVKTKVPAVLKFEPELAPEALRAWVLDSAYRKQTPADFTAISIIIIIGSIIGSGCGIRPKEQDEWEVIPNLWGACVGRPSILLKTPSIKDALSFLERLQAEYRKQHEQEKADAQFDNLENEIKIKDLEQKIKKATKDQNKNELKVLKHDYSELVKGVQSEPTLRLLKTNETSIQSMTELQKQNPKGILVFRDELTGFLVTLDREDGQDMRSYYLEAWNGNGSYTDYKIGRGLTDAENICVSILGGIQPDKFKNYCYQALRGNNDGLIQRIQLAVFPDEPDPKAWKYVDKKPNAKEAQRVYDLIKVLADMDFNAWGAKNGGKNSRPYFRFGEKGQAIFSQWITELQTVKIQNEDSPLIAEHLGKYRSLMPSLALIFHLIDIADGKCTGPITARSARLAIKWCEYLESHARRIYAMVDNPEYEAAIKLSTKIKSKVLPNPFTAKIVYDKHWHGLSNTQEVEAACNILIDEGWLIMTNKPKAAGGGRPALPDYCINPKLL